MVSPKICVRKHQATGGYDPSLTNESQARYKPNNSSSELECLLTAPELFTGESGSNFRKRDTSDRIPMLSARIHVDLLPTPITKESSRSIERKSRKRQAVLHNSSSFDTSVSMAAAAAAAATIATTASSAADLPGRELDGLRPEERIAFIAAGPQRLYWACNFYMVSSYFDAVKSERSLSYFIFSGSMAALTTLVSERETGTVDGRRYNLARSSVPGMIIVRLCRDAHRRA
ncbi:unnamed protein product [Trichogramma brassicae]|uniref:Uncharacterized protein n=1 Tax=Trichogramma brassicae TaxID=86971 RepID=A0A6H5IQC0_9HYME|nr:unnamed protein product [Trichogramma brassicae]